MRGWRCFSSPVMGGPLRASQGRDSYIWWVSLTQTAPVTLSWAWWVGRSRAERARAGRCGAGPGEECISGGRRAWRVADHNILGLADRAAGWEGGREGGKKEGRKTNDSNQKETCEVVNQRHQSISNYSQALVSIRGQRSE